MHHGFDAQRVDGTGEFLAFAFGANQNRHGHVVFGELLVDFDHSSGFFFGLLTGGVGSMALLPQELGGAQEKAGAHFPANHIGPLVDEKG